MNVDVFRESVLADARAEASRLLAEADDDSRRRIGDAEDRADELRRRARQQGRDAERRRLQQQQADERRRAREAVLRARQAARQRLRADVLERLAERRGEDDLAALTTRCVAAARRQLGDGAQVEVADDGGVVARADDRLVDYRLASLVDIVIDDMGTAVQELWQ